MGIGEGGKQSCVAVIGDFGVWVALAQLLKRSYFDYSFIVGDAEVLADLLGGEEVFGAGDLQ